MLYSNKAWHWEKFNILNGYSWIIPFLKDKGFDTQTADIHTPQSTKQLVLYVPLCWRETRMSVHTSVHSHAHVVTVCHHLLANRNVSLQPLLPAQQLFPSKSTLGYLVTATGIWVVNLFRSEDKSNITEWLASTYNDCFGGGGQWSVTDEVGLQVNWGSRCWVHVILLQSA